jgi:hypothetical protein
VIGGFLGMAMFLGLYWMGQHPFIIPPFMDFRILLFGVFIFFTLRDFRDYFQGGILYFWQGMIMALVFTIVFSLVGMLSIWAYSVWNPEFVSRYVALKTAQAKMLTPEILARYGKENVDAIVRALPSTRGIDLALVYVWTSFGISFFLSIILSVILRRQPKSQ